MVWRTVIERPLTIEGVSFCSTGQSIKTFFPAPTSSKSFLSQETYANLSMRSDCLLSRETILQPADPTPTAMTESGFWSGIGCCSPVTKEGIYNPYNTNHTLMVYKIFNAPKAQQ